MENDSCVWREEREGPRKRDRESHTDTQRTDKDKGHLWSRADTGARKRCWANGRQCKGQVSRGSEEGGKVRRQLAEAR